MKYGEKNKSLVLCQDLAQNRMSNKLFGDEKTRRDNGFRVYKYVTEAENDKKIDLLVDTTRAFLMNCIDLSTFFRIYKAIIETLPEDLDYLKEITRERLKNNTEIFQGNTEILALNRNGMVIIAGIDGNKGRGISCSKWDGCHKFWIGIL